jgi:hypothetical protein
VRPLKLVSILASTGFLAVAVAHPPAAMASVPNGCSPSLTLHDEIVAYRVQATLTCRAPAFDLNLVGGAVSAGADLRDTVGVDCANARVCNYWSPSYDKSWGITGISASTIWFWRNRFESPIHHVRLFRTWAFAPPTTGG